jgi:hypothetical protein
VTALRSPLLDVRRLADIMAQLRVQAQIDLPQWNQSPPSDAGVLLQRVFARMMEIALQRLNRVPEKNLLAFLDAMGISLLAPSPAQTPLTFSLLQGSSPTVVPRGSQAGTLPSAQVPAVIFETVKDFTVIPAQLSRAFTMDPVWDRYADETAAVAGKGAAAFTPFVGTQRMPHILYLGDGALFDHSVPIVATLTFLSHGAGVLTGDIRAFWESLAYQYQSQGSVATTTATATANLQSNHLHVQIELPQPIDITAVQGVGLPGAVRNRWLQAVLTAPFPDTEVAHGLQVSPITLSIKNKNPFPPDLAFNDKAPLDLTKNFYPLGAIPTVGTCLYIASREAFSKPNCLVTLHVNVRAPDPPVLIWEYFDGKGWSEVPTTSISDSTNRLTKIGAGTISLELPASVLTGPTLASASVFIRGRLISGTYQGHPSIEPLTLLDAALLSTPTNQGATSIEVDRPNFAAKGQVVQVDSDYAVVTAVTGNHLTLIPALGTHRSGAPVKLKLTTQVATLSAEVAALSSELSANINVPFSIGSMLLTDDGAHCEFITVQGIAAQGTAPGRNVQITFTPPLRFDHGVDTGLAVVGDMHVYGFANDRWVDISPVTTDPFVPFGERPGPGNFFILYVSLVPDSGVLTEALVVAAPTMAEALAVGAGGAAVSADIAIRQASKITDFGSITIGNIGLLTAPFLVGRQVRLSFGAMVRRNPSPVEIAWEYLTTGGWTNASVVDNTNNFVDTGTISVTLGTLVAGEVNSQQNYWIRARINSGNYGVPLEYVPVDPAAPNLGFAILPGSGNLNPPVLTSLSLDYSANASPDNIIIQNGFLYSDRTGKTDFVAPFVAVTQLSPLAQADPEPAFYLGFDSAFPEQPVTLYVDVASRAFSGRVVRETLLAPSVLDQLPALRWEYFNGIAWHSLSVIDGTNNLTESGELTFETPLNIALFAKFDAVQRYWIRARSSTNDPFNTQRLDGIFLNTATSVQAVIVTGEIVGSSNGQSGQSFRFANSPVLPGQRVMVREPEPPSSEEAAELLAEEGVDAIQQVFNPTTQQNETWVRWHEVNNFLASQSYSRHYTLDHSSGALTFGALIPPIGSQNIVANYQSGGGTGGNLPRDAIAQVRSTLPAVASVANPTAADGGADHETVAMLEDRGPQAIRHRGHAVAAADIEWLAREAAGPRVARAKCIPNVNQDLVFEPGWITLLIVPHGTDTKPAPDSQLIREVETYLLPRAFLGLSQQTPAKLNVIGPGYIRVAVAAEIVPVDPARGQLVKQRVMDALAAYFHPLTGGDLGTGWPFGQPVYISKVARLIDELTGVDHVEALQLIPNLSQHRLTFDAASEAAVYLAPVMVVATVDRSKSALLAEAVDLRTGRVTIKGFKEGDKIAKVVDVTVQSTNGNTVGIGGFADTTGMPRGSVVMTLDGLQRTRLAAGILPSQSVSSIVLETGLEVKEGDVLTLVYPFPMEISAVTLEAIELTVIGVHGATIEVASFGTDVVVPAGTLVTNANATRMSPLSQKINAGMTGVTQITAAHPGFASSLSPGDRILLLMPSLRLDIEPYEAELPFAAGSFIATLDNGVRLPLLQTVPAGHPVTAIRLSDFAAGDLLAPSSGTPTLAVEAVEPAYDIVAMDDNFLVYSGTHRITVMES